MKYKIYYFALFIWITIVALAISLHILQQIINIEFSNYQFTFIYELITISSIPLASIIILSKIINRNDTTIIAIIKITIVMIFSVISLFSIGLYSFATGMCSWSTDNILYVNKEDPTIKIVSRSYGCGATDSTSPIVKIFKINEMASSIYFITDSDTINIDKAKWNKINNFK